MARRATWRTVSAGHGHRASDRTAVPAGTSGLPEGGRWRPDRRHWVSLRGYSRCAGARPATSGRLGEPGQPVALPPPGRCTHAGWRLRKPAPSLIGTGTTPVLRRESWIRRDADQGLAEVLATQHLGEG